MSLQTESIADFCRNNGHAPSGGKLSKYCLNCGVALPLSPAGAEVAAETLPPAETPATKPTNPKDTIGSGKLPMSLVPTAVVRYASLAFAEGALKYGRFNWRVTGVRTSIYLDAMLRHLAKFTDGEWDDPVTQVPHLASIIACAGIILDALECGKLNDDRPPVNWQTSADIDNRTAHVAHLKEVFQGYSPHQHSIQDADPSR